MRNRLVPALQPINPDAGVVARLRAFLARPPHDLFGPSDADRAGCTDSCCAPIRATVLDCQRCGYVGVPRVEPCECRKIRAENIEYYEERIAKGEGNYEYGPEEIPAALAAVHASPDRACRPRRGGSRCGHGMRLCPTCGTIEGRDESAAGIGLDAAQFGFILRGVRAILDGGVN